MNQTLDNYSYEVINYSSDYTTNQNLRYQLIYPLKHKMYN